MLARIQQHNPVFADQTAHISDRPHLTTNGRIPDTLSDKAAADSHDPAMTDGRLVADIPLPELQARAGALAREAGRRQRFTQSQWQTHWDDLHQTALLAFLVHSDRPLAYAYACARNDLRSYVWVHVHGLNGGWKSLAARAYTLVDSDRGLDDGEAGSSSVWQTVRRRDYDLVPRPVEWAVLSREAAPAPDTADLFRSLLTVLVGMSSQRWYPEQMYRGALVVAMRLTGHTWAAVAAAVGDLPHETLVNVYQEYRGSYLLPYGQLSPMGQAVIQLRGEMRVQWFEQIRPDWLRRPQRKIVVLPHGIYTLTYRRDRRRAGVVMATLQKGRRVAGKIRTKQVYLGPAQAVTKELVWEKSLLLEKRLASLLAEEAAGNLGQMNESRQVMFGVV